MSSYDLSSRSFSASMPTATRLQNTILGCIPDDGISQRNLLNKLKARGLHPSQADFRKALAALRADGRIRERSIKGDTSWVKVS